jgi:hypothetical protein
MRVWRNIVKRSALNSSMQDDSTEEMQNKWVKENNAERKRAMVKECSRRFREKKRLKICSSCGS